MLAYAVSLMNGR